MSKCVLEQRDQLRALAEHLGALSSVLAVDVIADDPTHGVCLEVVCCATHAGLPPRACRHIADARATVADVTPQGAPAHPIGIVTLDR